MPWLTTLSDASGLVNRLSREFVFSSGLSPIMEDRCGCATRPQGAVVNDATKKVRSDAGLMGISEIRSFFRTNEQPDLLRRTDRVQPARHRPLGPAIQLRRLLRLLGRRASAGVHPVEQAVCRVRQQRGDQQLPAAGSRGAEPTSRPGAARGPGARWSRWCSSTRRPRRSARNWATADPAVGLAAPHLDSKIVTTRLGKEAGAPSVPNVLAVATAMRSWPRSPTGAGLGYDLVVQTPYGDSGKTTFFITDEGDWDRDAEHIVGQEPKIMKRINNTPPPSRPSTPGTAPSSGRS